MKINNILEDKYDELPDEDQFTHGQGMVEYTGILAFTPFGDIELTISGLPDSNDDCILRSATVNGKQLTARQFIQSIMTNDIQMEFIEYIKDKNWEHDFNGSKQSIRTAFEEVRWFYMDVNQNDLSGNEQALLNRAKYIITMLVAIVWWSNH